VQLTVCDAIEQDYPLPLAFVGVTPKGSVSFTVTVPLLGPTGLILFAVRVQIAVEPRRKVPEWLLLIVMSGVHSAPDCVPEVWVMFTLVTLVPVAPDVAP